MLRMLIIVLVMMKVNKTKNENMREIMRKLNFILYFKVLTSSKQL